MRYVSEYIATSRYVIHFTLFPIDLACNIIRARLSRHGRDGSRKLRAGIILPRSFLWIRDTHYSARALVDGVVKFRLKAIVRLRLSLGEMCPLIRKIEEIERVVVRSRADSGKRRKGRIHGA